MIFIKKYIQILIIASCFEVISKKERKNSIILVQFYIVLLDNELSWRTRWRVYSELSQKFPIMAILVNGVGVF